MIPIALAASAAVGAGQMIYGAAQKRKAQRAADANVMPAYEIPAEEQQMLSLEESMAGTGMSAAAKEALRQNSDRLLGTSIDAIQRNGGNANAIGNVASNVQQQLNQGAIYDDKARLDQLTRLQSARARMSANRDKAYQINKYQPWANKAQAINEQLQGGQQMITSGFNNLGGAALGSLNSLGMKRAPHIPVGASTPFAPPSPDVWNPPATTSYGYTPVGTPFGMINENIDNTPVFNGWGME